MPMLRKLPQSIGSVRTLPNSFSETTVTLLTETRHKKVKASLSHEQI